eukprot:TRINITY_DN2956_c0_g2_i1.p2 TRINITY_DN2956_c0_g2~~TRINITY_DN2956_c0_g2_i1.p2  ORF type:complete len:297 (+),score=19.44 TRINITY_DN2956_c0_g2_i1:236-1126(+)
MQIGLLQHQHGKSRVRVGRVWREGQKHSFVEWTVSCMLESDMEPAYTFGDNTDMTTTDTQKNTVYYMAKQCNQQCSIEEFAIQLGRHFVQTYSKVSKAKIAVDQLPWVRLRTAEGSHNHGFVQDGSKVRRTQVDVSQNGKVEVISGVSDWRILKTTQSGYEGFCQDEYTLLPETKERLLATSVSASWRYNTFIGDYDKMFELVMKTLSDTFFGPCDQGVYSPSVQYTLYQMGSMVLQKVPEIDSIYLNLPNIHYLPCKPVTQTFENDVYIVTEEPHGNIEACLTRKDLNANPHCKL